MTECIICNNATEKFYDKPFDVDFYKCNQCDFIARDRAALMETTAEKEIYDLHNNSLENEGYVNMFKNFLDKNMVPYQSQGRKGLDFGSGPEPVLSQILERDYGYDMDYYDKFYAKDKVYVDKKYDLITCTEVVEHLDHPLEYFRLFASLLEEDGVLAIMTLFHHNDEEHFLNWHYRRDRTHISFFNKKTLAMVAEQTGLELIHEDGHRCAIFKLKDRV